MKLIYSRTQAKRSGFNYFQDVDGKWKRYTEIIHKEKSNFVDAVVMLECKKLPPIKVLDTKPINTVTYIDDYGYMWDLVALTCAALAQEKESMKPMQFIGETEIQAKIEILEIRIDKALKANDKAKFLELSKQYAILKQML